MIRKFTRLWAILGDVRGVAVVEFAFIAPILMMLTLGILDVGRAMHALNTIEHTAKEAARYASVRGGASARPASRDDIAKFVKHGAIGLDAERMSVQVSWAPNNSPGSAVVVDIAYDFNSMLVGIFKSDPWRFNTGSTFIISH